MPRNHKSNKAYRFCITIIIIILVATCFFATRGHSDNKFKGFSKMVTETPR